MMALAQWWDARITEGHTTGPEGSAALMLSLILPPRALGRVRFNARGAPALR